MDVNQLFLESFQKSNPRLMRKYLKAGANINVWINGQFLLHIAVLTKRYEIVKTLITFGIDVNVTCVVDQKLGEYSRGSYTPLQLALYEVNHKIVRLLMEHNANPCIYTHDGLAAIHIAVIKEFVQNVRYVLKNSDVNYPAQHALYKGWTALHFAIFFDKVNVVDALLENDADLACRAQNGVVPMQLIQSDCMMHLIMHHWKFENQIYYYVLYRLKEAGIDFNEKISPAEKSLYSLAQQFNFTDTVRVMKELGAREECTTVDTSFINSFSLKI